LHVRAERAGGVQAQSKGHPGLGVVLT
jgi:hypothetical protein